ncbi:bifunctional adenosylcobinamide kinase/adenosylcobinamide-phosphate guanylyltransferase [Spongiibacter taiwanensis]|uniref:bifunctional adenosylcobinamide kinase/adenosylcobinamide-phosphate guanylyltransferase n=1 Tax=Spongiibacter taiwanensis TaxID=1748242 RepID=UPI0020357485|nr:bifunctional adenosylcobinamide kinase/adenosylcobinamide-phosphate guanylyltransferase [Spongiibacter taiwanensis]USA44246.1 bifunctional adenosylcobinamide kinase/adenosylcobinamide-phosphate guanylyltransferase [Spongiibacter taiwanensis]
MLEFYLGGARSGKSRCAEARAISLSQRRTYIATATAGDPEMAARIAHHQTQRAGDGWRTVDAPEALTEALSREAQEGGVILVDCLTLWLSNWVCKEDSAQWQVVREAFLAALQGLPGDVVLVSNEVGCGIVPMGELSRRFVDEAGRLHQQIANIADRVVLVTAGIEQVLKGK